MQKFCQLQGGTPSSLGTHPNGCPRCLLCLTIQSRDFDQMHHSEQMTPPRRRRKKKTPHCVVCCCQPLLSFQSKYFSSELSNQAIQLQLTMASFQQGIFYDQLMCVAALPHTVLVLPNRLNEMGSQFIASTNTCIFHRYQTLKHNLGVI